MYGFNNPMDLLNQKVDIENKIEFFPISINIIWTW